MQVTVYGASGKVGQLVVAELTALGDTVVAFVHRSNPFSGQPNVKVIKGSVENATEVKSAVKGSEAVIVALGSWGSTSKTIVSTGTKQIIQAMTDSDIKRLITLTGASAFYSGDEPGLADKLTRKFLKLISPRILADGEAHLQSLEASDLNWTCVRSPAMTGSASTAYRLSEKLPSIASVVARRAVAKCLVDQLSNAEYIRKAPVIYRG